MESREPEPLDKLPAFGEQVDSILIRAHKQLDAMDALNEEPDPEQLQEILVGFTELDEQNRHCFAVFSAWGETQLSAFDKSEVTYYLGRIKRSDLVIKNILRMSRRLLGIPDFERINEELQVAGMFVQNGPKT